jgi:glycosyltransferase involved in cell wall biosynthesis
MVNKIQLNDIDFDAYECIKDKYNRIVDGVSHGRAIYFDSANQEYYKIFHPDYCRINNFRKAIKANFFEGLSSALISLIYDSGDIVGYVTKAGPLLSANEFDFHLIPQDFFRILKNRIKESGMLFYDLVPHNIILIDGEPSLIDLESVYDISEYNNLSLHNAKVKPAELDEYIKKLRGMTPMKISLIQPGRNNLKYLKWSYDSIRKNQGKHEVEICVADDFSNDGTWDWCQEMMDTDSNFKAIRNEGPTRLGHTILYDRLVNEVASHDICMIYHADMYLCPNALDYVKELISPKRIVSLTRIEPPLHPPGPEKILQDFGIEPEEFREADFIEWYTADYEYENIDKTTEGIFAPWAFYKKDFQEINGHDPLYAPQSKEDSDIFNRFQLNGVKFIQTWSGCVYHMTCRGSRFADGAKRNPDGEVFMKNRETDEWLTQNKKATRNFIRKWGHYVQHDRLLKPMVPPKYDIGFVITNSDLDLLTVLEPWCSTVYTDGEFMKYITLEQPNTLFKLRDKFKPLDNDKQNEVLIQIDGSRFTQQDYEYIQQMSEILASDEQLETGNFELGSLVIDIIQMNTYEKELIVCEH